MTRPATTVRYKQIIKLWMKGSEPKEIVALLSLLSVHVVYNAFKWYRKRKGKLAHV